MAIDIHPAALIRRSALSRYPPPTADRLLIFRDGTHIIYVNGATRSKSEIGKLVHDLTCTNAAEMYFDVLKKQVSQFKNSVEGRRVGDGVSAIAFGGNEPALSVRVQGVWFFLRYCAGVRPVFRLNVRMKCA